MKARILSLIAMMILATTSFASDITDGFYRLQNNNTSRYISINNKYWTTPITQTLNATALQQVWQIKSDGNGGYTIRNCFTGLYLGHQDKANSWFPMTNTPYLFYAATNDEGSTFTFSCTQNSTTTDCLYDYNTGWLCANNSTQVRSLWKLTAVTGDLADKATLNLTNAEISTDKIYRISNVAYANHVARTLLADNNISTDNTVNGDVRQYWKLSLPTDSDAYTIQNLYTQRYIQDQTTKSASFFVGIKPKEFVIIKNGNKPEEKNFAIARGRAKIAYGSSDWVPYGIHCASSLNYNAVLWDYNADASFWNFIEATDADAQAIADAQNEFISKAEILENTDTYTAKLLTIFSDSACTVLRDNYLNVTDNELTTAMNGLPTAIINMALKIKNNSWAKWEQEFRVASYKPYSRPEYWASKLSTMIYSRFDNPTGITGKAGQPIYVYVDHLPNNSQLYAETLISKSIGGPETATKLKPGLNVFYAVTDSSQIFIRYWSADGSLLSEYPDVKIHIEGGKLDGFFDARKHTDDDWLQMRTDGLFTDKYMNVVSNYVQWHIQTSVINYANQTTLVEAIRKWDSFESLQLKIMGLTAGKDPIYEDLYPKRFNNHIMVVELNPALGDAGLANASNYRVAFNTNSCKILVLTYKDTNESDNGSFTEYDIRNGQWNWSQPHEIGHVNQKAINCIGTTEVSNNLFSQAVCWASGNVTTRMVNIKKEAPLLAEKTSWMERSGERALMYANLYEYFHILGNDTTFYPKVFHEMRNDLMDGRDYPTVVSGYDNYLKLARVMAKCAKMNLNDYFTYWGLYEPYENDSIVDYGRYSMKTTQEDIDATKAYIAQQGESNGAMIFIDDRVTPIPRTDGVEGFKRPYSAATYKFDYNKVIQDQGPLNMGDIQKFKENPVPTGYSFKIDASGAVTIPSSADGACGIKIYDQNGTLAYVAATNTFTLPSRLIQEGGYIIKIQKYDGTDIISKTIDGEAFYVDDDNYATYYTDKDFIMPDNTVGGIVKNINNNAITIDYIYKSGDVVPAGTGLILKGKYGISNYALPSTSNTVEAPTTNYLKGTTTTTDITAKSGYLYYKLSYDSTGKNLGFYWGASDGGSFTNSAHKAYLEIPVSGSSPAKFLSLDTTSTDINSVQTTNEQKTDTDAIYNLQGQRVSKDYHGIVIMNGKKRMK